MTGSRNLTGLLTGLVMLLQVRAGGQERLPFFRADHPYIQYTGRIDFTRPALPRFWQPGVYITLRVTGPVCNIVVNDELLWGKNHNYLELVVNGVASRIQTRQATDTIVVAGLKAGANTVVVCKNTEANIGYVELVGVFCRSLLPPPARPKRKIECIGNSITCGTGADATSIPCGKGLWQDQHNAYLSYGPTTARALGAEYHLSAVSGIGLMHSCCNLEILMPGVFDKISMRNDTIAWDFRRYQPDVVTVCLGQNDGVQDSAAFCTNYIRFLTTLRKHYPKAEIICLSSPMADATLVAFMQKTLTALVSQLRRKGEKRISAYIFSRQYNHGCDWHPDLSEHSEIAKELTAYIRRRMRW